MALANALPKDVLEIIVAEAICKHRYLRDIAELRHAEWAKILGDEGSRGPNQADYVRAMIDMHAQQTVLSNLLGVLGYIPKTPTG